MKAKRLLIAAALVAGSAWLACGGDDHDVCPNGCDLPGNTIVKWQFNNYPAVGFDSDACSEVQAAMVHVDMTGIEDATVVRSLDKQCTEGQATFGDLPVQNYSVAVTPVDAAGESLVKAPVMAMVAAAGTNDTATVTVNVKYEQWAMAYTGQFLYQLKWGGAVCSAATPVVLKQKVKLTIGGVVSTATTMDGEALDGSAPFNCVGAVVQNAMGLTWGPATFEVTGYSDAAATTEAFKKTFDTFIGAGTFNPTLTFDVVLPDAGVDGPPDA